MKTNKIYLLLLLVATLLLGNSFKPDYKKVYEKTTSNFKYRTIKNDAFKPGEVLNYRIHYGWINAASATISAGQKYYKINGRKTLKMKVEGKTYKSFNMFFKVHDKFESYVDMESLAPQKYLKSIQEDKYRDKDFVIYRHDKGKLFGSKGDLKMKPYTHDLVSAFYYTRNLDYSRMKIGGRYPISIYLDNKIYDLSFKYMGKETIKSDVGRIKCIKIKPELVVDKVFKSSDALTLWISDDKNHIPVRIKSALRVGSIKVDLKSYSNLKHPLATKK